MARSATMYTMASRLWAVLSALTILLFAFIIALSLSLGGASYHFLTKGGDTLALTNAVVSGNLSAPILSDIQHDIVGLQTAYRPLDATLTHIVRDGQCKLRLVEDGNPGNYKFVRLYYSIVKAGINAQPLLKQTYLFFNHTNVALSLVAPRGAWIEISECKPSLYPFTFFLDENHVFPLDVTLFQMDNSASLASGLMYNVGVDGIFFQALVVRADQRSFDTMIKPLEANDPIGVQLVDTLYLSLGP